MSACGSCPGSGLDMHLHKPRPLAATTKLSFSHQANLDSAGKFASLSPPASEMMVNDRKDIILTSDLMIKSVEDAHNCFITNGMDVDSPINVINGPVKVTNGFFPEHWAWVTCYFTLFMILSPLLGHMEKQLFILFPFSFFSFSQVQNKALRKCSWHFRWWNKL